MHKLVIASGLVAVGALGLRAPSSEPVTPLAGARIFIEYDVTAGAAVLTVAAESDRPLQRIEIRSPLGTPLLELAGAAGARSFSVDVAESEPFEMFAAFPEGRYDFDALASDGRALQGSAFLSHALPAAPLVLQPTPGAPALATTNATVSWLVDPAVDGYELHVEQDDNDGLSVQLPKSCGAFTIPDGLLAPGQRARVEIGALGAGGNRTVVEVEFRTF